MTEHLAQVLSVGERVAPMAIPEREDLPTVTYRRVSAVPTHTHDGPIPDLPARIQWDCWGRTYLEAISLEGELRAAIDGFQGYWGDVLVGSVLLSDSGLDDHDPDRGIYRRIVDGFVTYREQGPPGPVYS